MASRTWVLVARHQEAVSLDLRGKRALVTGAGRRVGAAIAAALGELLYVGIDRGNQISHLPKLAGQVRGDRGPSNALSARVAANRKSTLADGAG